MKGQKPVIVTLNDLLADELSAINQYMVHSEMCKSWGYGKLHEIIEKRAIEEMKHGEILIGRILFLEGQPIVTNLKTIHIGEDVFKQLDSDRRFENEAIVKYNQAIALMSKIGDNGTKTLLEKILADEEKHLDELEEQLDQIKQMTLPHYLSGQRE